jgi:hypothetical protein
MNQMIALGELETATIVNLELFTGWKNEKELTNAH